MKLIHLVAASQFNLLAAYDYTTAYTSYTKTTASTTTTPYMTTTYDYAIDCTKLSNKDCKQEQKGKKRCRFAKKPKKACVKVNHVCELLKKGDCKKETAVSACLYDKKTKTCLELKCPDLSKKGHCDKHKEKCWWHKREKRCYDAPDDPRDTLRAVFSANGMNKLYRFSTAGGFDKREFGKTIDTVEIFARPYPYQPMAGSIDACSDDYLGTPFYSNAAYKYVGGDICDLSKYSDRDLAYTTVRVTAEDGSTACASITSGLESKVEHHHWHNKNGSGFAFYDKTYNIFVWNSANTMSYVDFGSCFYHSTPVKLSGKEDYVDSNHWHRKQFDETKLPNDYLTVFWGDTLGTRTFDDCVMFGDAPGEDMLSTKFGRKVEVPEMTFGGATVSGSFVQQTPFHPTWGEIRYENNSGQASQFHIHEYFLEGDALDGCHSAGGLFNPYKAAGDSSSRDTIAVGNLAKKYGTFDSWKKGDGTKRGLWDSHMPLWGEASISGRPIMFHGPDGRPVACANLGLQSIDKEVPETIEATVNFTSEVIGTMKFRQSIHGGPVSIVARLRYQDSTRKSGHASFHVHTIPGISGSRAECGPGYTGGHYNPSELRTQCRYLNPVVDAYLCEVGDLSNKHGKIEISGEETTWQVTDEFLTLMGKFDITDVRSIVIHDPVDGSRMACGPIVKD